jgi:hypothetical protein
MKNATTQLAKGMSNQPGGGGELAENPEKILFQRNEPKKVLTLQGLTE